MEERNIDIHKAAGILIKDRKFLLTHELGKKFYISPGGVIEEGETPQQALVRELKEEIDLSVNPLDLEYFGTFYAQAAGAEHKFLQMDVYRVLLWSGEIRPSSGAEVIDDAIWVNTINIPTNIKMGSIFEHEVMPKLKALDLID
ncbi:MAG TPA: NUDIX domain-containing protein [Candidatus Saccharimonadales bacterium]|nr:NUDIX domain-containing protein [Candidatus Saccharimonadales bacterium]